MEPKLSTTNLGSEKSSVFHSQSYEQRTNTSSSEALESPKFEQSERSLESAHNETNASPILPPPVVISQPLPPVIDDASSVRPVLATDTPLVASDDDLIEKEWVDKAKRIILDTKEDPYRREKEVALLQSDYLKKRYGRELGASQ